MLRRLASLAQGRQPSQLHFPESLPTGEYLTARKYPKSNGVPNNIATRAFFDRLVETVAGGCSCCASISSRSSSERNGTSAASSSRATTSWSSMPKSPSSSACFTERKCHAKLPPINRRDKASTIDRVWFRLMRSDTFLAGSTPPPTSAARRGRNRTSPGPYRPLRGSSRQNWRSRGAGRASC